MGLLRIRVLGFHRVALGVLASLVAVAAAPDPVGVPLREVSVRVALLAVGAFAAVVPMSLASPLEDLERVASRSCHRGRLEVCCAVGVVALLPVAACLVSPISATALARNVALCLALAFASTTLLPAAVAWMPCVSVLAGTFVFGVADDGHARAWALLLRDPTVLGVAVAGTAAAITAAHFVLKGPRRMTLD